MLHGLVLYTLKFTLHAVMLNGENISCMHEWEIQVSYFSMREIDAALKFKLPIHILGKTTLV